MTRLIFILLAFWLGSQTVAIAHPHPKQDPCHNDDKPCNPPNEEKGDGHS